MNVIMGNDNGNSGHKFVVNGELREAPNVNAKIEKLPRGYDEGVFDLPRAVKMLHENIVVNIASDSIERKGLYVVGSYALTQEYVDTILVGEEEKHESDVPIINTLAQIAVYGIQEFFQTENDLPERLTVHVDMATALPVTQYTEANSKKFREKFRGLRHVVTVYMPNVRVDVDIKFDYVKVLPEGVAPIFALEDVAELRKLVDKKILHGNIGEGTFDSPVTEKKTFVKEFIFGENNGVGYAIDETIPEFVKAASINRCSRQYFSHILRDKSHKYHARAMNLFEFKAQHQAENIVNCTKKHLTALKNDVDALFVYGGGSILMKRVLHEKLAGVCRSREIDFIYCPEEQAVSLEAKGLFKFATSNIFTTLKEKAGSGK